MECVSLTRKKLWHSWNQWQTGHCYLRKKKYWSMVSPSLNEDNSVSLRHQLEQRITFLPTFISQHPVQSELTVTMFGWTCDQSCVWQWSYQERAGIGEHWKLWSVNQRGNWRLQKTLSPRGVHYPYLETGIPSATLASRFPWKARALALEHRR